MKTGPTKSTEGSAFLVIRAWKGPGGELVTRVGAVTDPVLDPGGEWEACLGIEQTVGLVRDWLQRWSLDASPPPLR